ncbi:lambda phage tail tape-measure family protein, partial [Escherichia coli 93.0055]
MAAMLTGAEADWRGFTRSVLSMLTEIFLKQAMVGIVGSIGSAIGGAFYSAAIFLIPICISFDTAEKRRYATYL